jgi:hypothetical protein
MTKKLLDNPIIIKWCFGKIHKTAKEERDWGNKILKEYFGYKKDTSQWTTIFGEQLVKESLIRLGRQNVCCKNKEQINALYNNKKYNPDLYCDEYIYEVKTRNWSVPGTAGEKILGVPLKYSELPLITGKNIKIILVAYQEEEAKNKFGFGNLCNNNCNENAKKMIKLYKELGFEYIGFTDILKQLGFGQ